MACPAFTTGGNFLSGVISHIDCQAQTLGTGGFAALADPGSGVFFALTSLLTVFIALFGIRLMLGVTPGAQDLVGDVVRIGIVLTLATSWPAMRIIGYDVVMKVPQELAGAIGRSSDLPGAGSQMLARMQNADDGMIAMTAAGSGRLTGGIVAGADLGDSPRGVALADQSSLGFGRLAFLAGILAPLGMVRIVGGFLIAVTPLIAGLLLFGGTRGIFFGWLRGLAAVVLGNLALLLLYAVELAAIDPWLTDVLARRAGEIQTPAAPTELLVLTLSFALMAFAILFFVFRMAFHGTPGFAPRQRVTSDERQSGSGEAHPVPVPSAPYFAPMTRAGHVAEAVAGQMRREERWSERERLHGDRGANGSPAAAGASASSAPRSENALGYSYRRARLRTSAALTRRDNG